MAKFPRLTTGLILAALMTPPALAASNEFEPQLRILATGPLAALAAEPAVLDAIRAQNAEHAGLTPAQIDTMDKVWRAEVGSANRPMIDGVLSRPGSAWLRKIKDDLGGLVTEVFVTDNLGLNVIQSDVTSDYWQGDEAKWSETFGQPSGTLHLGDVELDESTQTYQSQLSFPINDPVTGVALGAVTVGINLELLQ